MGNQTKYSRRVGLSVCAPCPVAVRQSLCTGLLASPKRVLLLRDAGQSIERNSGYSGLKFIRTVFQYIFVRGSIFVPPGADRLTTWENRHWLLSKQGTKTGYKYRVQMGSTPDTKNPRNKAFPGCFQKLVSRRGVEPLFPA